MPQAAPLPLRLNRRTIERQRKYPLFVELFRLAVPSYRFCRPDDVPLLVRAVETCYRVHDPDEPPWTAGSFRRGMREIDLWPSNSMVALDTGGEPVAVMIGTKRPDAVAVHRLAVRPDHLRQGHGLHLLTSLSQKLAVLGPDRLVAEVPDDRPAALACFAAAGYEREATLVDWERPAGEGGGSGGGVPEGLVEELAVADLDAAGVLADAPATAWCRTRRTLLQSADRLSAAAVLGPERVEGWIVFRGVEEERQAAALDAAEQGSAPTDSSERTTETVHGAAGASAGHEGEQPSRALAGRGSGRPGVPGSPSGSRPECGGRESAEDAAEPAAVRVPATSGGGTLDLVAVGAAEGAEAAVVLGVLLRWLAARQPGWSLVARRLGPDGRDLLAVHGFAPGRSCALLTATATPL